MTAEEFYCNKIILFSVCSVPNNEISMEIVTRGAVGLLFTTIHYYVARPMEISEQRKKKQNNSTLFTIDASSLPKQHKDRSFLPVSGPKSRNYMFYMLGKSCLKPKQVEIKTEQNDTLTSITAWKMKILRLLVNRKTNRNCSLAHGFRRPIFVSIT